MKTTLPVCLKGYVPLLFLFVFLTCFSFKVSAQVYSDGANGPVIFYDNAEQDPKASWGTAKIRGWNYFSGGDHNPANTNQSASVKRVTQGQEGAPAPRAGNSSYRMRVIKDNGYPACCNYVRSEMYWGGGNGNEFTGVNWQAVSMYIPNDWCDDNRPIGVGFDNKFANAQGPASFYLKIENGQYQVNRQYPQGGTEYRTNIGAVQKGRWVDFVLHRNYKGDNTGFMELFMDKKMVWSHYGPNYVMEAGGQTEGYVLQGIYKWSWSSSNGQGEGSGLCNDNITIYYDEFKFGNEKATLESMSPGGNNGPAPSPNANPTVQSGNNQTITLPTNTANLTGTAADSDGSIAGYAWTKVSGPNGGNIQSANNASTQITGLTEGTYVFRLTVRDNDGATATDDVQITVNAAAPGPNAGPTVQSGNNQTITLPTNTVNLNGTAADSDGSIAGYAWTKVSGPNGGNIQSANNASTQITGLTEGTYVFRLTVRDNDGATASDEVQITVNAAPTPNTAPTASAGDNITITLPLSAVTLSGSGEDADGRITDYLWTKVNGPAGENIQTNDAATTRVTGLTQGTYIFRLVVTDNDGATAQDQIQVTVNQAATPTPPPNAEPEVNAGANKTITLPVNTVSLNGSGQDSDGTIADYTWTKVSGPAGGAIASPDAASTDITNLVEGTYVFRLTVTDNDGARSEDDVTVTVNAAPAPTPNVGPQATAGANQAITLPVNAVTLNGNGVDSDGRIADYTWEKISGPAGGTIADPDDASTRITGLTAGTYVFRITVTDNDGAADTDDMIVVVNPEPVNNVNEPPTAAAGSDIAIRLPVNSVTLNGSGADDDGQIASYRWIKVSGPANGNFQSATAQSTSFTGLAEGIYIVRLIVTDNDGASTSDEVQITVRPATGNNNPLPPANEAPSANAGADIRITLPVNTTTLNGVGTDVDGTLASFAWTKITGPTQGAIVNSAAQSTGVTGLVEGVYEFRLTVVDNDGAKSSDDIKVTVRKAAAQPANQAPSATAGSDRVIQLPVSTVNLRGDAVDPDGTVISYNWKKMSGPAAGTIQAIASAGTSVIDLKEGEYVYRLTVKDDKGAEGSDEIKVTVRAAAPAPVPNKMPVADAGTDITITLPEDRATLNGTKSSDPDGTISSYRWVMVKGPVTGTMTNANLANASLTDLVEGVYQFELTVFDNDGASSVDRVLVTVIGDNSKPVIITSDTVTVLLPAQNTQVDANQSYDSDGIIQSFYWTKVSGPGTPKLLTPNSGKTIITDLVAGTYQFSVTVTDNEGAESVRNVTVIVKNSTARRLIPVINLYPNPAETNVTITVDSEVDGKSDVVFYDILGRPVLRDTFNKNTRTYQRKINISHLSDGVYAVEISIDRAEKVVRKVVKQ